MKALTTLQTDFVSCCLFVDLELVKKAHPTIADLRALASLATNHRLVQLEIPDYQRSSGLQQLSNHIPPETSFLVGHNIVNHDRPFIETAFPQAPILNLPVVDTLYLSPLAYPERPYHKLVKEYKQAPTEKSNPEKDCQLTNQLLRDCAEQLAELNRQYPGLIDVYRSCLIDGSLAGTGQFLSHRLGAQLINDSQIIEKFIALTKQRICLETAKEKLNQLLSQADYKPAVAYALAWLLVAGRASIVPYWVRNQYPQVDSLIDALRGQRCQAVNCAYCSSAHNLHHNLYHWFKFSKFQSEPATADGSSLQEELTKARLANQPLLGIMPTGGGKSLCFQLPAIMHYQQSGALTIVVSPLQALARDQIANLHTKLQSPDIAGGLNGLQTTPERQETLERLSLGDYALLYVAPEQLRSPTFKRAIRQRKIAAWIFDEVHCLAQWGHDFRADYHYAGRFIKEFAREENQTIPPVGCFTATARLDVQKEICQYFREQLGQELKVLVSSRVDRANLSYLVEEVSEPQKLSRIIYFLETNLITGDNSIAGSAIIYARSRKRTEEFAEHLQGAGWAAEYFHAGLTPPRKKEIQDSFTSGQTPIIVATNAFGMGIDKDNVRLVIHVDIPSSVENYLQEAGRAGRDQQPASCVLLFSETDIDRQFNLLATGQLTQRDLAQILRAIRRLRQRLDKKQAVIEEKREIVVSAGDLLRVPGTNLSFAHNKDAGSTGIKTAISWLERAKFVLRNENRPRIFVGGSVVMPMKETRQKIEQQVAQGQLEQKTANTWIQTAEIPSTADPQQGLDLDWLATRPMFVGLFKSLERSGRHQGDLEAINHEVNKRILWTLFQMTEAGIIRPGIHFSAWLRHKHPTTGRNSTDCLKRLDGSQMWLVSHFLPRHYNHATNFELLLEELQPRLRQKFNFLNEDLALLINSWERPGGGQGCKLEYINRWRWRVHLTKDWFYLQQLLKRRTDICHNILKFLSKKADEQGLRGEQLIFFTLDDLIASLKSGVFGGQIKKPTEALMQALLFLDKQGVIKLDKGLALFRSAMTLNFTDESQKGAYTLAHYQPLQAHYQSRIFQIHVMDCYAKLAQEQSAGGEQFIDDYFKKPQEDFRNTHMADIRVVNRPVETSQYKKIVGHLSPTQREIVTASKNKNLLVLADPGSGKTRVVVHRCAYLLQVERIRPQSLLVVCYNRHAMHELRYRIRQLVGDTASMVAVHTYHSLALKICERSILAEYQAREAGLTNTEFQAMITKALRRLRGEDPIEGRETDEVRNQLLAGYEYILVDEYQDINQLQYELLSQIARQINADEDDSNHKATILAVGDDDQTIYGFQGAKLEFIQKFQKDFGGRIHYLVENYRSTAQIIGAANHFIAHNPERLKVEHPIEINQKRRMEPAGGAWEQYLTPFGSSVCLAEVNNATASLFTIREHFYRLKQLDATLQWSQLAVLTRTNAEAERVKAFLLEDNLPVRWPMPKPSGRDNPSLSGLPLLRVREFRHLLDKLTQQYPDLCNVKQLQDNLVDLCGQQSIWTALAYNLLNIITNDGVYEDYPSNALVRELKKQLLVAKNEYSLGEGVFVGTVHSAKGLEFDHVVISGEGWSRSKDKDNDPFSERRLYYVAMTRAKHTLLMISDNQEPLPYLSEIKGGGVGNYSPPASVPDDYQMVGYGFLGMEDIVLSYPSWQPVGHPIHQALRETKTGDAVYLQVLHKSSGVGIYDNQNRLLAKLSKTGVSRYHQEQWAGSIIEAAVFAIVQRTKDDGNSLVNLKTPRVESWEIPLIQVRHFPKSIL